RTGALPELVNNENGILVPAIDENLLAEAMLKAWKEYISFDQEKISAAASKRYGYAAVSEAFKILYDKEF
ncbi:MAG: hypothetical protein ACJ749_06280, partial [Flavisolibacter sp.]